MEMAETGWTNHLGVTIWLDWFAARTGASTGMGFAMVAGWFCRDGLECWLRRFDLGF